MLFLLLLISCKEEHVKFIQTGTKNIKIQLNGQNMDWRVSPEANPDVLQVYCAFAGNKVVVITDIDSVSYTVSDNDTIRFAVILNEVDTAWTEFHGIKEIPNNISKEEKLFWLAKIWSEIKYNFINADLLNFDQDSLYMAYIPIVANTKTDYEFYQALKKYIALFHDGHTQVSDGGQFYRYRDYIPLGMMDFNEHIYITRVRKSEDLDSTWVGAEVIEIQGIPTLEYLEAEIFPYIAASTIQHLWMQGVFSLQSGFKDEPFKAKIKRTDGTEENIELAYNGETTRQTDDEYWGRKPIYPDNIVALEWKDNDIAYINFSAFYPEDYAIEEFNKIRPELNKAKGLIIDLRSNGGGSTEVAWFLQKHLTNEKSFLNYAWQTRINDGVYKANGNWIPEYEDYFLEQAIRFEEGEEVLVEDSIRQITCPVVILIGRFTFSAAEDFLVNLYEVPGRPLLIGEETGGSTGSPLVIGDMPGDGYARICTRRICYPYSHNPFANEGVVPDIEVKQDIENYLAGRDVVLETAIIELSAAGARY